jgi:hypothetical protein
MAAAPMLDAPGGAATLAALGSAPDELGQVLALLRAAGVERPESLGLGVGDRRLLELHRALTGRDIEVAVGCAGCGTTSVAVLSRETVPPEAPRVAWLGPGGGLREPTYADLQGLPDDRGEAEAELLRRCTVGTPAREPGPAELELVDDSLVGPVVLACVECGAALEVAADVEQLALRGLQEHAADVELEIHLLARAYGWSLATIEALPDVRRSRLARFVADGR